MAVPTNEGSRAVQGREERRTRQSGNGESQRLLETSETEDGDVRCEIDEPAREAVMATVESQLHTWSEAGKATRCPGDMGQQPEDSGAAVIARQTALEAEMASKDAVKAQTIRETASQVEVEKATAREADKVLHKRQKRMDRQRNRLGRREQRERLGAQLACENKAAVAKEAVGEEAISADIRTKAEHRAVHVSRTRRRFEKMVRKGRACQARKLSVWKMQGKYPENMFGSLEEAWRHRRGDKLRTLSGEEVNAIGVAPRCVTKVLTKKVGRRGMTQRYEYHSGGTYPTATVKQLDGTGRAVRMGQLRVKVGNQLKNIKLGTGAQYFVVGDQWKQCGAQLDELPPVEYIEGFTGAVEKVIGVWRFQFVTQYDQSMTVDALMVEGATVSARRSLDAPDWGKDDFTSCEMKWYAGDEKKVVPFSCRIDDCLEARTARVQLFKKVKIRTGTCRNVELAVVASEGTEGLFVPTLGVEAHLLLAPTLTTVRDGKGTVPVMNLVGRTSKLPKKETLGTWTPTNDDMQVLAVTGELDRDGVQQWLAGVSTKTAPLTNEADLNLCNVNSEGRDLLITLLRRYPTLLKPREGCPPMTTLGWSTKYTQGRQPLLRRHPLHEQAVIDEEVDTMLQGGVIEESCGAGGFPVVLVKKKDGSMSIHYHESTTLWIKFTVPVAEKDRDKTGFVTRRGLFRFVRMPFGLANAPGTFQRMMDAVLLELTWQSCLDDVNVFSKGDVAQHVVELAAVLERLSQAGLSLKARKCSFAQEKLEYLGNKLDDDGVRPMGSLVESVESFPVPTDTIEGKRFGHMAVYYRRFVPNVASKAAPMTKLLRKGAVWRWAESQQEAFESLKDARPLLAYPDFSRPFRLVTDASQIGLGAELTQGQEEQPVAYGSKVNSPTVAKYSITDLKCAAVVWAEKLFRPYVYGRKFELGGYISGLYYYKNTTLKLCADSDIRTVLFQTSHNHHKIIVFSINNDGNGRTQAPVNTATAVTIEPRGGEGQLTIDEIRKEQMTARSEQRLNEKGKHGSRAIVTKDDLHEDNLADGTVAKVLREYHDSIYAGHPRTPQTYVRVSRYYRWPDVLHNVRRWVNACRDRGSRKAKAREVIPPLRSQEVGAVGDRRALDVAGPLPLTAGGNRYVVAAVPSHMAKDIAKFIADKLVLVYGPMREIVMDGAPELNGQVVDALVNALQAGQVTPVPYRPASLGLVERFHRTWKDMVVIYVAAAQDDRDRWLPCAAYAYNGAKHSGTGFSPNERMMGVSYGRRMSCCERVECGKSEPSGEHGTHDDGSASALAKDQQRRARYYNKRVMHNADFSVGDLVWVFKPPRGEGSTKLVHQWLGPAKIQQAAGFDNWEVVRDDNGDHVIAHSSFLVDSLGAAADTILEELVEEDADDVAAELVSDCESGSADGSGAPPVHREDENETQQAAEGTRPVSAGTTDGAGARTQSENAATTGIDEGGNSPEIVMGAIASNPQVEASRCKKHWETRRMASEGKAEESISPTRRGKPGSRDGKLCVTSRKPQRRHKWVQLVITGYTSVAAPMETKVRTTTEYPTIKGETKVIVTEVCVPMGEDDESASGRMMTNTEVTLKLKRTGQEPVAWSKRYESAGKIGGRSRCQPFWKWKQRDSLSKWHGDGNATGQDEVEYEVEYSTARTGLCDEVLDDAGKIEDDLEARNVV
ncbi:LOW QUALITY PROTEIN: Enzymatic Polyprotein [Phytophthora palmivora]|uniref:Enzymatic Polyprotein n=1 Tax=Phytophthora palmivora TaxID=4796 RepID=A0A2P4XL88_9STRA|nr:LOW QUALITY PROTEIN: Enzymatic Polyprotein [Phytophthora palmivora]